MRLLVPRPQFDQPLVNKDGYATQPFADWIDAVDVLLKSAPWFPAGFDTFNNAVGAPIPVAKFMVGLLSRIGPAGAFADTTPTAAEIVAALRRAQISAGLTIAIRNVAGGVMTLNGGAGVTMQFVNTIGAGNTRWFLISIAGVTPGAEAVTITGFQEAVA